MAEYTEVGFVYQCLLCGSYSIITVDTLDNAEVALRAAGLAGGAQKTLQRDVHTAQEELLEAIQLRLVASSAEAPTPTTERFALVPCSTCTEIQTDRLFLDWLDGRRGMEEAALLCPQVAVTFEENERPPAYVQKAGKWCLSQGVGPKDLEVKLPFQLPAGQFRTLLPQEAQPLRPPCWRKEPGANAEEPPEVWEERRFVLGALLRLTAEMPSTAPVAPPPAQQPSSKAGPEVKKGGKPGKGSGQAQEPVLRAPPIGRVLPWLKELQGAAEEAWRSGDHKRAAGRGGKKGAPKRDSADGACYVRVPLLCVVEAIREKVEELMLQL